MKNNIIKTVLFSILAISLSLLLQSFTSSTEKSITKPNHADSTNVKVLVNIPSPSVSNEDKSLYNAYLKSEIDKNRAYMIETSDISDCNKDTFTTSTYRLREIMKCTGKNKDVLYQELHGNLLWKFISCVFIILLFAWLVSDIFLSRNTYIDWRYQCIKLVIILLGVFILNLRIDYLFQYVFNHGYLLTQEIIKLI
jgi:hypothetical protein